MKPSRPLLGVATLALIFLFSLAIPTAIAGSMANGAAQRQKLVIDSIDGSSGTVVFKSMVDLTTHTYKIDATTRISVTGKKGTIDEIKPGMKVVNFTAPGEGQTLEMIMVYQAPAASPSSQ